MRVIEQGGHAHGIRRRSGAQHAEVAVVADHLQRQSTLAVEHFVDASGSPDGRHEVFSRSGRLVPCAPSARKGNASTSPAWPGSRRIATSSAGVWFVVEIRRQTSRSARFSQPGADGMDGNAASSMWTSCGRIARAPMNSTTAVDPPGTLACHGDAPGGRPVALDVEDDAVAAHEAGPGVMPL